METFQTIILGKKKNKLKTVPGRIYKEIFGIRRKDDYTPDNMNNWIVTLIPCGFACGDARTLKRAKELCDTFLKIGTFGKWKTLSVQPATTIKSGLSNIFTEKQLNEISATLYEFHRER